MNPEMPLGIVSDGGHGILVGGYGITNKTAEAIVFALNNLVCNAKQMGVLLHTQMKFLSGLKRNNMTEHHAKPPQRKPATG